VEPDAYRGDAHDGLNHLRCVVALHGKPNIAALDGGGARMLRIAARERFYPHLSGGASLKWLLISIFLYEYPGTLT
jgi:hypothetical protein